MSTITKEKTLEYHKNGKIGTELTKPCSTQEEPRCLIYGCSDEDKA